MDFSSTNRGMRHLRTALLLGLACAAPLQAQVMEWSDQYGTAVIDVTTGLVPDGSGGVFATGVSQGFPFFQNDVFWIRHLDVAGNVLWHQSFGSSVGASVGSALGDGSGGFFAAGTTKGDFAGPFQGGVFDAWVARFDASGQMQWAVQLGGTLNEYLGELAPDGAGGVFAVGSRERLGSGSSPLRNGWVVHLDGGGAVLWERSIGSTLDDDARAVASDGAGGVFVAGWTSGDLAGPNAGGWDLWWARFDAAGTLAWARQSGTPATDELESAAPDGLGGFFVCGTTHGDLAGNQAGEGDAYLARVDAAGDTTWIRQFGTPKYERAEALAAAPNGGVLMSGFTAGDWAGANVGGNDAWLARFDTHGSELWSHQFGSPDSEQAVCLVADSPGALFVGGLIDEFLPNAWVARFDVSCGWSESYCTASGTSIAGCAAALSSEGVATLGAPSGFTISTGAVPGGNLGLAFFGNSGPASTPFGTLGGQICVAGPIFRSAPKPSGGGAGQCDGLYTFTLQDLANASPLVTPGAALNVQVWARDPANADGFLLSDALAFTVCP